MNKNTPGKSNSGGWRKPGLAASEMAKASDEAAGQ